MQQSLPNTLDDINTEWLSQALQNDFPGVNVRSRTVDQIIQGTSTKAKLTLDYHDQQGNAPRSLWVKGNFTNDRQYMADLGIYTDEVRFYRDLQPELNINSPVCYYAQLDSKSQGILLLEDLLAKKVEFGCGAYDVSQRSAQQIAEQLAALHARWWQHPTLDTEFAWADDPLSDGPRGSYYHAMRQPETWSQRCMQPHALALPRRLLDIRNIAPAMEQLMQLHYQEPRCLLHGDPHIGNIYFEPDGTPGLYDWQCVRRGHWSHDLNYALVSSLDIADRREWEQDLLRHYLASLEKEFSLLEKKCATPSFEEAWTAYRKQNLYGLFFWITNTEDLQPFSNNAPLANRFAIAALDHNTLELLR
ncbi:phosphotransferase [Spongiibacter sp. KMU-166]|uniref:Phosphotransferase n=1 Tax=Spongiibacter thalassae TaxID=2721624 RepID=A0ABX1GBU1_9GAMM|nr:phosphotransferase [Spongiibacter thalassae]NKI15967.1 phosphotransferase [Spongiibacter thalassae]